MEDAQMTRFLELDEVEPGGIRRFWIDLVANGVGQSILVPAIVAKGKEPGPVLGLTAVVHGNELNGLKVVQNVIKHIDTDKLRGCVVGIPVVNVPSILNQERRFIDGEDLNRLFPGKADGNVSEVYAFRIIERIVSRFNYLIDLHTASFGRINSYYIRANMEDPVDRQLAILQDAQIILHNKGKDGTLRAAAEELGIKSITVEVGNPNRFQPGMIDSGLEGIFNVMHYLDMIATDKELALEDKAVHCSRSYWIYADRGGLLDVHPELVDRIKKGDRIAVTRNVFGDVIREYFAPEDGVVIGKSTHPVNQTGGRILHLGIEG